MVESRNTKLTHWSDGDGGGGRSVEMAAVKNELRMSVERADTLFTQVCHSVSQSVTESVGDWVGNIIRNYCLAASSINVN